MRIMSATRYRGKKKHGIAVPDLRVPSDHLVIDRDLAVRQRFGGAKARADTLEHVPRGAAGVDHEILRLGARALAEDREIADRDPLAHDASLPRTRSRSSGVFTLSRASGSGSSRSSVSERMSILRGQTTPCCTNAATSGRAAGR